MRGKPIAADAVAAEAHRKRALSYYDQGREAKAEGRGMDSGYLRTTTADNEFMAGYRGDEPSAKPDYHFVLRFMDDEQILHELELDDFQIVLRQAERRLSISLTPSQTDEIRDLRILRDRLMP
jgi:hypothetical protein